MNFDLVAFGLGTACGSFAALGIAWACEEWRLSVNTRRANTERSLDDIPDVLPERKQPFRAGMSEDVHAFPGQSVMLDGLFIPPRMANTGRTNRDIPDVLAGNLDALFAARDQQISEQQANESRHSRRDTVTMGDVFEDFARRHPARLDYVTDDEKANASRHSRRVGGKP